MCLFLNYLRFPVFKQTATYCDCNFFGTDSYSKHAKLTSTTDVSFNDLLFSDENQI